MVDDLVALGQHRESCTADCSLQFCRELYITRENPLPPQSFGNHVVMYQGRPKWNEVLERFTEKVLASDAGEQTVGVFFCGTPVVGDELRQLCISQTAKLRSSASPVYFIFHQEIF